MTDKNKGVKWGYILIGLFLLAIAACFIAFSNSLTVLAVAVGITLAVFAVVFGVLTIAAPARDFGFAVKIIFSIICLISGVITAIFNEGSVDILVAIFCLLLIVDGAFKLNTAAMSKRYSVGGWLIMMIISVLVIISAFALARYTPDKAATSTMLLGIIIAVDALSNLLSTIWVAKYESAARAEIYYEIHGEKHK